MIQIQKEVSPRVWRVMEQFVEHEDVDRQIAQLHAQYVGDSLSWRIVRVNHVQ